jgi:leader peptidase (prepilin peptidase)/N-methyltransferase
MNDFGLNNSMLVIIISLVALVIGSFLNVVIYRLPKIITREWTNAAREYLALDTQQEEQGVFNLSLPASHCYSCKHKLAAIDNIPLVSFLCLAGKCRYCKVAISWQYPLVEVLAVVIALISFNYFNLSIEFAYVLVCGWILLVLAAIDAKHKILPDILTLSLLWLGLIANSFNIFTDLPSAVWGAIAGYSIFFSVHWLFKLATGKEGMGQGDFKLLAALGACCGWQALLWIILISSLLGIISSVFILLFKRAKVSPLIPYGLYLAIAGWGYLLWGNIITTWYFNLMIGI